MSRNYLKLESIDFYTNLDEGKTASEENLFLFEIAWEIANKVGGIYTVLRSKAPITHDEFGDQFVMIGPYKEASVRQEVEVLEPEEGPLRNAILQMRAQGVGVVYGRWLIDSSPRVVLFDIGSVAYK